MASRKPVIDRTSLPGGIVVIAISSLVAAGCASTSTDPAAAKVVEANLARFDQLDFQAYNKQNWALFRQLHCPDVVVTNPDGSQTRGIDAHMQAIGWVFSWSPDSNIPVHPTRVGAGDLTAVTGQMRGTFAKPMAMMDGSTVPATGKTYNFPMATFAKWRGGCIAEEQLFYDNLTMMKQIGLAK